MAGDTNYPNVSLLLHGNGANGATTITDNSPTPKTVTCVGNAKVSTAQSLLGGSSLAFDGTGDYMSCPSNTDFDFPGDFTVELSAYLVSYTNPHFINRKLLTGAPVTGDWAVFADASGLCFYTTVGNYFTFASGSGTSLNTWYRFAVVRSGTTIWGFKNGEKSTNSFTIATNFTQARTLEIGRWDFVPNCMNGYLDEIRITKGVARYSASYAPDAAAFPDGAGSVSGVIRDENNALCARTVRLHRRDTGALIASTVSDPTTGAYFIWAPTTTPVHRIVLDDTTGEFSNDRVDRVTPP